MGTVKPVRQRSKPWYSLDTRKPRYYPYWMTWTEVALYAAMIFVLVAAIAAMWIGQ